MTAEHLEKGRLGEAFAADYLAGLGWEILERNVSFGEELDIIAMDGGELVVAEVRTRSEDGCGRESRWARGTWAPRQGRQGLR